MGDDEPPLIEVLGGAEEPDPDGRAPERAHWHTTIRTVAVVVGALALLWVGSSVAGMRTTSDRTACRQEVDYQRWLLEEIAQRERDSPGLGRPTLPEADVSQLLDRARECGLDSYADALERRFSEDDEDDEDSDE